MGELNISFSNDVLPLDNAFAAKEVYTTASLPPKVESSDDHDTFPIHPPLGVVLAVSAALGVGYIIRRGYIETPKPGPENDMKTLDYAGRKESVISKIIKLKSR